MTTDSSATAGGVNPSSSEPPKGARFITIANFADPTLPVAAVALSSKRYVAPAVNVFRSSTSVGLLAPVEEKCGSLKRIAGGSTDHWREVMAEVAEVAEP